jgi:hypothetical protein
MAAPMTELLAAARLPGAPAGAAAAGRGARPHDEDVR